MQHVRRTIASGPGEYGLATIGLIAIVMAVVGGAALGVFLVLGGVVDPIGEPPGSVPAVVAEPEGPASVPATGAQLLDCRGGHPVDSVTNGDSVFVVGIDESGEWAAIRRPSSLTEVGWLPVSLLAYDQELSSLPVLPCVRPDGDVTMALGDPSPSSTTTTVPVDTTISVDTTMPPPDTTIPVDTTMPPPDTTISVDTTMPLPDTTIPIDTAPPVVVDLSVLPDVIYPGAGTNACDNTKDNPIFGSAYATVTNEADPVTATLSWMYLPTTYAYSGSFTVSVEPSGSDFLLIGSISDLPQPYVSGISAPQIRVEITWVVTDTSGNSTTVVDTFDLGRCV